MKIKKKPMKINDKDGFNELTFGEHLIYGMEEIIADVQKEKSKNTETATNELIQLNEVEAGIAIDDYLNNLTKNITTKKEVKDLDYIILALIENIKFELIDFVEPHTVGKHYTNLIEDGKEYFDKCKKEGYFELKKQLKSSK